MSSEIGNNYRTFQLLHLVLQLLQERARQHALALEQPFTSRELLAITQPPQAQQSVPLALSLSENNLYATSQTFNYSECVVHIHNH